MAAPDYVPKPTDEKPRVYASPPRRLGSWMSDRPAEVQGLQPVGPGLGVPGPDQGYALLLARQFEGKLVLTEGERDDDVLAGCMAVATRRSALYGRAPVIHDLTLALNLWGYLAQAPEALVALRRESFAGVASSHHYTECRAIVDNVSDDVLRMTPSAVAASVSADPAVLHPELVA
jgi:hypothetical protein